jgi:hypothetical protein
MLSLKTLLATTALVAHVQASYYTVEGWTSNGGDMLKLSDLDLDDRLEWCSQRARCVAFDSNGNTRRSLQPRSQWEKVVDGENDEKYTMWIKKNAKIPADSYEKGYEHYKGYAIKGNSITRVINDVNDQKQWCNRRRKCIGFNSNGWMKQGKHLQKDWSWFGAEKTTLYIKGRYSAK